MTFREKLQNEYPNADIDEIVRAGCPDDYGYETYSECGISEYGDDAVRKCEKCWNREMPDTDKPFTKEEVYTESGYNKGLNDAWELAKKISKMDMFDECFEIENVFGECTCIDFVLAKYTPQEALAKLKAYEEQSKIEVGDIVVIPPNEIAVVTKEKEKDVYVCFSDGSSGYFKKNAFKKTGKHIDIKSFLEQIGE